MIDESTPKQKTPKSRKLAAQNATAIKNLLEFGEIEMQGLVPWSSNYTYLVRVYDDAHEATAVYKPQCGERPLWDFETGSLCRREVAAYELSVALGWTNIPVTVLRDGPQGVGALQQFVEFRRRENFFTLRDRCRGEMEQIALFDALINNTDRKGGHVLLDASGTVWCIDHGVTFHEDPKLRTVIWDFVGDPIPPQLLCDLEDLRAKLRPGEPLRRTMDELLTRIELRALDARLTDLLRQRVYPEPPEDWPHIPWPPL